MAQPAASVPTGSPPSKVIFVGGAPRSGTSVTQALICTATAVNSYHPEISFVRPILESYVVGIEKFSVHTRRFFREPEHFKLHARKTINMQLMHISAVLQFPSVLCVKDPMLTPLFPAMREVLGWPSQYVTVLRHPHHVIRSLQEVVERGGDEFDEELIQFAAQDYLNTYEHIEDPSLEDALMCLRYEDLEAEETIEALRDFTGLPGIDPDNIWKDIPYRVTAQDQTDPWYSPKFYEGLDTNLRLSPLAPHICEIVNDVCGGIMEDYGYLPDGRCE